MRFSVNDFYKEQLYEIRKGIKQGLDVKLYANPVYNEFQMRELRLGLLNKVKINYFQSQQTAMQVPSYNNSHPAK